MSMRGNGQKDNSHLDERDRTIRADRLVARDKLEGPRVGDFIRMKDGRLMRFSHDWGDGLQVSHSGSFFIHKSGNADFSGGLEPSVPREQIELTDESETGRFWIFSHNHVTAHNGVDIFLPCRVYRQI